MEVLLGLAMIYSVIHFFIIQHSKIWLNRSSYEKLVSVFAIISITLVFIGVMFG